MTSSLFSVCNAFHLGAYQVAINEASELNDTELSATERVEKDCYAYRSYVALGSYQVRIVVYVVALFFFSLFFSLFCCAAVWREDDDDDDDEEEEEEEEEARDLMEQSLEKLK